MSNSRSWPESVNLQFLVHNCTHTPGPTRHTRHACSQEARSALCYLQQPFPKVLLAYCLLRWGRGDERPHLGPGLPVAGSRHWLQKLSCSLEKEEPSTLTTKQVAKTFFRFSQSAKTFPGVRVRAACWKKQARPEISWNPARNGIWHMGCRNAWIFVTC